MVADSDPGMMEPGTRGVRCLAIVPVLGLNAGGGDEVVYRKTFAYLAKSMSIETLELASVGVLRKVLGIAGGNPPEVTRYISGHNRRLVTARLAKGDVDVVLLCNEVTFPMLPAVKAAGVPAVLAAHNVHSLVASTESSRISRVFGLFARAFERRWYADPAAELVLISKADQAGLEAAGIKRDSVWLSPPGVPPAAPFSADAGVRRELVITGSYGWWRKRRDLKALMGEGALGIPIFARDATALEILANEGHDIANEAPDFWEQGIRFGLVTDSFVGGFKLKSLEYVANNCIIVSRADIRAEFAELPHADRFVRFVKSQHDIRSLIDEICSDRKEKLVKEFLIFKNACLERFDWNHGLAPMADAIQQAINRKRS